GATDRHHLLLTAGERPSFTVAQGRERREQVVDVVDRVVGFAASSRGGAYEQVLVDSERRKDAATFGHVDEPSTGARLSAELRHLVAFEGDRTAVGLE